MKIKVDDNIGERVDIWLSDKTSYSRSHIKTLIKNGNITINENQVSPSYKVRNGDLAVVIEPNEQGEVLTSQDIPLDIIYQDDEMVVINKQAGIVVHPAPGHKNTIINAVMYHCNNFNVEDFEDPLRPGVVHRLDKDTSGILVVAKNIEALKHLKKQFKDRSTKKEYLALVKGILLPPTGRIETSIGRSRSDRKKMSTKPVSGARKAITNYKIEKQYEHFALVRFHIETGRTHQIRVHASSIGHPILGDSVYGHKNTTLNQQQIPRQMLHAAYLEINHPVNNNRMSFKAELPDDMVEIMSI
jgi:23S rRNA pseudouridine1911/1915/1917 synthase